jgi:uncharacterized protein
MRITLLIGAVLVLFAASCTKEKNLGNTPDPGPYDKHGMLVNMADAVIIPDYARFSSSLDSVVTSFKTFTTTGSLPHFSSLKEKFRSCYKEYQRVSPYEFGPAETAVMQMNTNVFPTDTGRINNNINAGGYSLSTASNLVAKGLPALDYLLFGHNASESSMHYKLAGDTKRQQYVSDILADMQARTATVRTGWNDYRNTFVNSLGTDVGSSIGFLVNRINFELDYLKNAKVGIPAGKKTLGQPVPGNCEAFYSGYSVEFALETLYAIERMYRGGDGKGFDDYLEHLESKYGNELLTAAIDRQFNTARTKLQAIPSPLSAQVTANPAVVDAAYVELVKLLVLLKTDMPSALGVVITYQDGDGD